MKTRLRFSACALLALGSATFVSAVTPGTLASFSLALTLTESAPGFPGDEYEKETVKGSVTTNEYKEKMVTSRVGVREVLQEMLDAGQISEPIAGWGIVAVDVPSEDGDTSGSGLVAVKAGEEPVAVPSEFSAGATASTFSDKTVYDEAKDTTKYSGGGTYKQACQFILLGREMYGIRTGGDKWVEGNLKVNGQNYPYEMFLDGAASLKGIVGVDSGESEDGYYEAVIEGTASLAAAKVADVEGFLSALGGAN